jgi:hypothetical protein
MNRFDFIGFSLDEDNQPTLNTIERYVRNDVFLDWYVNQDYVFEWVADGGFHLLTKEEFIKRYDEHSESTIKKGLNFHNAEVNRLSKEIELYDKFKEDFLNEQKH